MMVLACHSVVVLVDLDKDRHSAFRAPPTDGGTPTGFWKAFKSGVSGTGGYRQAFLRGYHAHDVSIIEVSTNGGHLVTAESAGVGSKQPLLVVWDVAEGKRLVSMRPHSHSISAVSFSADATLLATVGLDAQVRLFF